VPFCVAGPQGTCTVTRTRALGRDADEFVSLKTLSISEAKSRLTLRRHGVDDVVSLLLRSRLKLRPSEECLDKGSSLLWKFQKFVPWSK
jgi:hypothetical protein